MIYDCTVIMLINASKIKIMYINLSAKGSSFAHSTNFKFTDKE